MPWKLITPKNPEPVFFNLMQITSRRKKGGKLEILEMSVSDLLNKYTKINVGKTSS